MSSSHLFLGLPIALLVLYLELRSRLHSAAFFSHLSLGEVAILSANFHFIFCGSCSSIESLHVPSCPMHLQCFSVCNRSSLPDSKDRVSIAATPGIERQIDGQRSSARTVDDEDKTMAPAS